jgi:hypothetical protein
VRIREDPIDIDGGSSFSLNRHKILLWFVKKIDYDLNIEERKS